MSRIKEIWNGRHRAFVRYAVYATAVFIVYMGFISRDSAINWAKAKIQLQSRQREIQKCQKSIDEMNERIENISSSRDSLEKFARENFFFTRKGDEVFLTGE